MKNWQRCGSNLIQKIKKDGFVFYNVNGPKHKLG